MKSLRYEFLPETIGKRKPFIHHDVIIKTRMSNLSKNNKSSVKLITQIKKTTDCHPPAQNKMGNHQTVLKSTMKTTSSNYLFADYERERKQFFAQGLDSSYWKERERS
jgi:hypothetical protein